MVYVYLVLIAFGIMSAINLTAIAIPEPTKTKIIMQVIAVVILSLCMYGVWRLAT